MIAATLSSFWPNAAREKSTLARPVKRPGPVFIGDAVQPFGQETMLLAILRKDSDSESEDDA